MHDDEHLAYLRRVILLGRRHPLRDEGLRDRDPDALDIRMADAQCRQLWLESNPLGCLRSCAMDP